MVNRLYFKRTITFALGLLVVFSILGLYPNMVFAADVTIKGRLMIHPGGNPSATGEPVRNAKIKIYDEEIINYPFVGWAHLPWPDDYIKTTYTDNDGYFSTTINNDDGSTAIGDEHGRDIYLKVVASNSKIRVKNNPSWIPFSGTYQFQTGTKKDVGSTGADFGTFYPKNEDQEIAFETLSNLELAWNYMRDVTGIELAKTDVFYKDLFTPSTSYCFPKSIGEVLVLDSDDYYLPEWVIDIVNLAPVPFTANLIDDLAGVHLSESNAKSARYHEVLFHEYGHYVMDEIGDFYPPFTTLIHSVDVAYDPEHAFQEGWAHFFSSVVRDHYGYPNPRDFAGSVDLETAAYTGDSVEGSIAAAMWDFYDDTPSETGDDLNLEFTRIVSIITNCDPNIGLLGDWPIGADHPWNIQDYFNEYAHSNVYSPTVGYMWKILDDRDITILDNDIPVNPTGYTSSHNGFIGNPDPLITVDFTGAYDLTSGIEAYYYLWDENPVTEMYSNVYYFSSETPHIEHTGASDGHWYLHVFVKDNAGNVPVTPYHAGPFFVGETQLLQIDGSFTNWLSEIYTKSTSQVTLQTSSYGGKQYTHPTYQFIGPFGGEEMDYNEPFSLQTLGDGLFNLKISGTATVGGIKGQLATIPIYIDNTAPTTQLQIGTPKWSLDPMYVTRNTQFTLIATDAGSGVSEISYRIVNGVDTEWMSYDTPFFLLTQPDGVYTVHYKATDNLGNSDEDSRLVYLDNSAPVIDLLIGNPKIESIETIVDDTTPFSITANDWPGSGVEITAYRIILDEFSTDWVKYDGSFILPSFGDGLYVVKYRSMDRLGNSWEEEVSVVTSLPPIAEANGPYVIEKGYSLNLYSTGSYDPDGKIVNYDWDLDGDSEFDDATGETTTHTWNDNGFYTVGLRVTDDDGASDTDTSTVTIGDLGPSSAFTWSPETQNEGSAVSFTDVSTSYPDIIVSWSWDFDREGTSADQNPSFTFMDNGLYSVALTVTDDDGSTDSISHDINILNVPPTANPGLDQTVNEGSLVTLDGSASYDPGADTLTYEWDLDNDGSHDDATGVTTTHTWNDNGFYTVGLRVTDDDGGVDVDTVQITVNNVAPSTDAGPDQTGQSIQIITLTGHSADPGSDDLKFTWNWGDNTVNTENVYYNDITGPDSYPSPDGTYPFTVDDLVSHTYTAMGVYTVTLTVTDDDGESSIDTVRVVILPFSDITSGGLCLDFDTEDILDDQFRIIYTPDVSKNPSVYKIAATNPGQFYYNVFHVGDITKEDHIRISIPAPFVTQGQNPVHIYDGADIVDGCYVPQNDITSDFTITRNSNVYVIESTVSSSGVYYVNIHLNYGLKQTTDYEPQPYDETDYSKAHAKIGDNIIVRDLAGYKFEVSGLVSDSQTVYSRNVFKKIRGIVGFVSDGFEDVLVTVSGPKGEIGTAITDEDGFFGISFHHKGKETMYTITASGYVSEAVYLKAGRLAEVILMVLP